MNSNPIFDKEFKIEPSESPEGFTGYHKVIVDNRSAVDVWFGNSHYLSKDDAKDLAVLIKSAPEMYNVLLSVREMLYNHGLNYSFLFGRVSLLLEQIDNELTYKPVTEPKTLEEKINSELGQKLFKDQQVENNIDFEDELPF